METAAINSALDRFLGLTDQGFGLIQSDVGFVLNCLVALSITLAGVHWALKGEAPIAPLFQKVLFIGFFSFLVQNWNEIAGAINASGAMLGLRAGGSSLSLAELHDPAGIADRGKALFGRVIELNDGLNVLTDFPTMMTIWVAALAILIAFFVLALQIFVQLITFKLGSLAAFVAVPWGVFSGTAWVAERPLGWVASSAMRLFLLAFVVSFAINFVDGLSQTVELGDGDVLDVLLIALILFALSLLASTLASEVMQGSPSLSAAQPIQAGAVGAGSAVMIGGAVVKTAFSAVSMINRARTRAAQTRTSSGGRTISGPGGQRPLPNYSTMQPRPQNP